MDKCFRDNIDKGFELDVYHSDESSESDSEIDENLENRIEDITDKSSLSSKSFYSDKITDEYIAVLKKIPVQLLFIEKLEGTLEDLYYMMII